MQSRFEREMDRQERVDELAGPYLDEFYNAQAALREMMLAIQHIAKKRQIDITLANLDDLSGDVAHILQRSISCSLSELHNLGIWVEVGDKDSRQTFLSVIQSQKRN